jgi:HPt (histidine-containing phosphotransfer) domain-containing protein
MLAKWTIGRAEAVAALDDETARAAAPRTTAAILDESVLQGLRSLTSPKRPTFFADRLREFLQSMATESQAVEAAVLAGDAAAVRVIAHRFKTSCGIVGARALHLLYEQLEALAKDAWDPEEARSLVQEAKTSSTAVAMAIQAILQEPSEGPYSKRTA